MKRKNKLIMFSTALLILTAVLTLISCGPMALLAKVEARAYG